MPEILTITTSDWDLMAWTKDIEAPSQRLSDTLSARGKLPCTSAIRFSPPLNGSVTAPIPVSSLPNEVVIPRPVFFENRLYEFDFRLKGKLPAPRIEHWRSDVQDAFHLAGDSLRGLVNFGNDVGWFRLAISWGPESARSRQYLSFEVMPTKMDMDADFGRIASEIDDVYPLWRFAFARKTEQELAASRRQHERFSLLWLALFKSLREDLEQAVKLISRSPHARLLPQERLVRPDRLKGRLAPRLTERVSEQLHNDENHLRYRVETRRLSVDTPENRFVKMVLTRCSRNLGALISRARSYDRAPDQTRLTAGFYREVGGWQRHLEQRLAEPLFRAVGQFGGLEQESLVLHHRTGYSKVYRIWQDLKLYLDLFGSHSSISMKSISDLYELWCVLEIRKMLKGFGFEESPPRKASLITNRLERELAGAVGTAFHFERQRDGLKVRLAHEPCFSRKSNLGIYSFTADQRPDILLEAEFKDGELIRWVFDAKYRISPGDEARDSIPEDAINQMHRYRDALIYRDNATGGAGAKSRPIIGAFVLYPGFFGEQEGVNPYQSAIDEVGIGGFPLLPGHENRWLKEFLKDKFGDLADGSSCRAMLAEEHLLLPSVRIPPTGLRLSRYEGLTLAASTKDNGREYLKRFHDGVAPWYHMKVHTTDRRLSSYSVMQEVRHLAPAVHQEGEPGSRIEFIYDVLSVRVLKRCDIAAGMAGREDADNDEEYWLFELGTSRSLKSPVKVPAGRRFHFRLTSATDLIAGKAWEELSDCYAACSEAVM